MLKIAEWQNEKDTLHRLAQILGKHKLASAFQEPQWAHVTLTVTPRGFTTGMLYYKQYTYSLSVDLVRHLIIIETAQHIEEIPLKDGTSVQDYYHAIQDTLNQFGIQVTINTTPQAVDTLNTFFNQGFHIFKDHLSWQNCHYYEIPLKMKDNQIQQKPY